jgi:hypothetical protein
VQLFQLLLCASGSAGGSTTHPADLSKVSLVGQFPSSSSISMSLNSQIACVLLSAGPCFSSHLLNSNKVTASSVAMLSGQIVTVIHVSFRSVRLRFHRVIPCFICCHRPRCRRLGFSCLVLVVVVEECCWCTSRRCYGLRHPHRRHPPLFVRSIGGYSPCVGCIAPLSPFLVDSICCLVPCG